METMGTINNNGVTIDKSPYYVGQTISLYAGKSFLKDGRISKIEKAD
jgi:ribosomal protein S19